MEGVLADIRFALKLLRKEKSFSATVLTTLALCIGANVAIFSVIHTVLLEPLPYRDPGTLVNMYNSYPGAGVERASSSTVDFFMRRERVQALQDVALMQGSGHTVGEAGSTERVTTMRVTPSLFPLLGVTAAQGRTFTEEEMEDGHGQVVLLTDGYWREALGGAPDVVGTDLRVNGEPYQIVGILPPDFEMVTRPDTRFFLPVTFTQDDRSLENWHSNNFQMIGRLRAGATIEQVQAQVDAMNESLIDEWPLPNARQLLTDAGFHTVVVNAQDDIVGDARATLYMLWAGVAFVLLIGCVNIANLMMARSQVRLGELATKLALGARRARVARQVLSEAALMSVLGGVLGVGVGALGLRLLLTIGASDLPRGRDIGMDGIVLAFTAGLALVAGILFAAIPVAHVMRSDLSTVFRMEGRTGTASRRAVLVRNTLVTSQVALAFVLLIGAGLMLLSFRAALGVDPGFQPRNVWSAFVSLPGARYPDPAARRTLWDGLLAEVRALPGVQAASLTSQLPFTDNNSSSVILPEGYELAPGESLLSPFQSWVGPGYFEAMGIPVLEGREFEEADGPEAVRAIVIDRWLAQRYWPDSSPLGKRMVWGVAPGTDSVPDENAYTVVGVVGDIKQNDLTAAAARHVGAYYFTYRQQPISNVSLVVRTATEPENVTGTVRSTLNRLDPELPLFGVESLQDRIDESLTTRRAPMMLLLVFSGVALFLAMVGIYGALAYSVTQRTREMGIRMAMGSAPESIFRMVLAQGARVTLAGLAVGLVLAVVLGRLLQSLLFGVQAADPLVLALVAVLLGLVAMLACLVPARRATRVDPVAALTYQ